MGNKNVDLQQLVSVIVPVYNVEKYINECIDSILAQTYSNFELILVDDGSSDGSGRICDKYRAKDNRIKVIHQKNGGVTAARIVGFNNCSGSWVCFVDSDDTIPSDSLSVLMSHIIGNDVICGRFSIVEEGKENIVSENPVGQIETHAVIPSMLRLESSYRWELCGKIIKKDIISNQILNVPRTIVAFEDYIISLRLLKKVEQIEYIEDSVYNYRQRMTSVTHTYKPNLAYVKKLSALVEAEFPDDYEKERFEFKMRLLAMVLDDRNLTKEDSWYRNLLLLSKKFPIGKTKYIMLKLIEWVRNSKARSFLWNRFCDLRMCNVRLKRVLNFNNRICLWRFYRYCGMKQSLKEHGIIKDE